MLEDMKNTSNPPMVQTVSSQRDANMIKSYLESDEPFILVGPEGCGKSLVIKSITNQMKSCQVAIINCNAQTSAFHIL